MTKQTQSVKREYQAQYRYHMEHAASMDCKQLKASADELRRLRTLFQVELEAEKFGQQVR